MQCHYFCAHFVIIMQFAMNPDMYPVRVGEHRSSTTITCVTVVRVDQRTSYVIDLHSDSSGIKLTRDMHKKHFNSYVLDLLLLLCLSS